MEFLNHAMQDMNVSGMEHLQWSKVLLHNVDYFAFIDLMRYNNHWVPWNMNFLAVNTTRDNDYVAIPLLESLKDITINDIHINITLDRYPVEIIDSGDKGRISHFKKPPVDKMKEYLKEIFPPTLAAEDNNASSLTIATVDKATYHFLVSHLPAEYEMVYFGPEYDPREVRDEFEKRNMKFREAAKNGD